MREGGKNKETKVTCLVFSVSIQRLSESFPERERHLSEMEVVLINQKN